MADAQVHAIRLQIVGGWIAGGTWASESWANTINLGLATTSALPPVSAGEVALPPIGVNRAGGSFTKVTGAITWTCVRGWTVDGATDSDGWFKSVLDAFFTWYQATTAMMAQNSRILSLRFYPIGDQGRNPLTSGPILCTPGGSVGSSATSTDSPDRAVVISLYTANLSKRGRGRFYYGPLKALALDTNGLITSTDRGNLANPMAAFMTALRATTMDPGGGIAERKSFPIVLHREVPYATGSVISKVRVGDEVDLQERRTKKRPETYTEVAVT